MSTRIGNTVRAGIQYSVDELLGRSHNAFPFPIKEDVVNTSCHNRLLPPVITQALRELEEIGYATGQHRIGIMHFDVALDDGSPYRLYLGMHVNNVFEHGYFPRPPEADGTFVVTEKRMAAAYREYWPAMKEWILNSAPLRSEMIRAHCTATEILNMITTAGQLKRMVPEMLSYLPSSLRESLDAQQRASSVPYLWSSYDRPSVRHMLMCMSKCHLLPAGHRLWEHHPEHTALPRVAS